MSGHGRGPVVVSHHATHASQISKKPLRRGSRCGWNLDQTQALIDEAVKMHVWAVPHGHTEEGWDTLAGEISKSPSFHSCGGIRGLGAKRKYKELLSSYKETSDGKDGRPHIVEGAVLRDCLEKNRAINDPTQNVDVTVDNIVHGVETCVKGREAQRNRRRTHNIMHKDMGNVGPWGFSSNTTWPSVAAAVAAASSSQPLVYSGITASETTPQGYGGMGVTEMRGGNGTTSITGSSASLSVLADMVKRLRDCMVEENKKVESMLDQMGAKLDNITQRLGRG